MAKIKLTKTAVESAQPQAKDVELRDTVVPGFLCKITPTGRRVFMLQYARTSGQPRPSLGCTGADRRTGTSQGTGLAGRGSPGRRPRRRQGRGAQGAHDGRVVQEVHGGLPKKRNKPSTQDGYQGVIDRNIIPLLGRKKVHDVKRPDIAGLMEKLAYKPTEANKTFGVLRKMFNLAVWGCRPDGTNPCRHVPDVPAGQGNPAHRGRGNGADLPPVGEAGGGGAGELRHPAGDPAAIRVRRPALRKSARSNGAGWTSRTGAWCGPTARSAAFPSP